MSIFTHLSHLFDQIHIRFRNARAFGNGSRFLSASIFEHLPHHVLRKWFLSAAKGVQSNNKWHWIGGWSELGRGLSSTDCALSSSNKTGLEVFFASERCYNLEQPWGVRCVAILIVCTSLDSQRRAVLKWKQSRSCQGTISLILCVCRRRCRVYPCLYSVNHVGLSQVNKDVWSAIMCSM